MAYDFGNVIVSARILVYARIVKNPHIFYVGRLIFFRQNIWFHFTLTCTFYNLVINIGNVDYIGDLVADITQSSDNDIKLGISLTMADVGKIVYGRPANKHLDRARLNRLKFFKLACQSIM